MGLLQMKTISSACADSGGKEYTMNQKADKTLNIIKPFTLNRPEYPVNYKTKKTLCALLDEGHFETHISAFKRLIHPAEHFCINCGRSAVSEKNLCNPEKF